jgi:hypothetical protein
MKFGLSIEKIIGTLKDKNYLAKANEALPIGWNLMESYRMAGSGKPTFDLYLVYTREALHMWPVYCSMPRRLLKEFAKAVEQNGLQAVVDPNYPTYTSRVVLSGYAYETIGLREALFETNPSLSEMFDSQDMCVRYALPWQWKDKATWEEIKENSKIRKQVIKPYEEEMGVKIRFCDEKFLYFNYYKNDAIPKVLPEGAILLNFRGKISGR